ncbi:unnamed protein product [Rotaria sordida]|uniref:G-protein coupled receptors family 1 profile domain-containing protein n=1 Tax=Rotaria sordida TaxID=392033 RepID=A0A813QUJ5_9BILA|nr:unnamed protein product [Rotaria sordida]CAF0930300.1 unnamed protein product [Rotaria sordida]
MLTMFTLTNISLMIYFALVSLIGTLGNGIILLAYGNRWNSSKSTSVIFILILACVDLWTCLIVVPTIAIMEHREFEVPTPLCRFYSFSKILIIISSLIMSFIALDRFLNIFAPHHRLLNPCRVKFLLTLFILIGIGLGILTALAFSSAPYREFYLANYTLILPDEPYISKVDSYEISITLAQKNSLTYDLYDSIYEQISIPFGANITNISLSYISTRGRCFADTSIISETIREILRHISNKFFFISIGIVTIFYTITFVLALQRQNPRIRALKKSLNVLNKFNGHPLNNDHHHRHLQQQRNDSIMSSYSVMYSRIKNKPLNIESKNLSTDDNQQSTMSNFINNDIFNDQNISNEPKNDFQISTSETPSDDLQTSIEKFSNIKQVSFQIENDDDDEKQQLSFITNSIDNDLNQNTEKYYKLPCPCSTTQHLLIKFHFIQPTFDLHQWFYYCCCCFVKKSSSTNDHQLSMLNSNEDEITTIFPSTLSNSNSQRSLISNSAILKRQLYRHRLKQIRMASTFLLITVSFVVFYLPSILNAERYIKSPLMIYYLYLCTHALNPIIYCFMNRSLRDYVLTMFKCRTKRIERNCTSGATTILER